MRSNTSKQKKSQHLEPGLEPWTRLRPKPPTLARGWYRRPGHPQLLQMQTRSSERKRHCKNLDLDLSDEGFWDGLLGRVCNRERAVLRQTSSQDFLSEKGRSETDPLGRVISESCLRNLAPRSRSQKVLSKKAHKLLPHKCFSAALRPRVCPRTNWAYTV